MTNELETIKSALNAAIKADREWGWIAECKQAPAAVERLEAERQTPSDSDNYVAWLCHKHRGERQWLAMCDSDTPGAFKVYRRTEQEAERQSDTEQQIARMVNRFLQWRLPKDFQPDCGIHFDANAAKKLSPNNHTYEPIGTNLFSADQAKEMVRFMLDAAIESTTETNG